jgi:hypothetical protein
MKEKSILSSKDFLDTLESVRACKAYLEAPNGTLIGFAHFTEGFYYFFEMVKGDEENIVLKVKEGFYTGVI